MQSVLQLLSLDPAWIRTGLRVVHLCGLVLGVGSATLLDLIIARFILMRGISHEHVYVIDFSSKIVTIGLGLLWISGIGFLIHYGVFEPSKLQNPKIWAKIAIVAVLSVNGLLVHYFLLPHIRNQVGKRLLEGLSPFDCSLVLLAGTVSVISWYVPLILGAIPQLNYVVSAEAIFGSYALLVIAVNTLIQGAIALFLRGYSFSVFSDLWKYSSRSKTKILRGSWTLVLGSICILLFMSKSLFVAKTADDGAAFIEPAGSSFGAEPKVALASIHSGPAIASSAPDIESDGTGPKVEQAHRGALKELSSTGPSEEKVSEQAESVRFGSTPEKPSNTPEQRLLERAGSADSFASFDKRSIGKSSPPTKSGFVGLWAADVRACGLRQGKGSDLRAVIDERGARAGANSCAFKEKKQLASSEWEMKASCADGSARWESRVRLSLSNNKLKWSGQRGTQVYFKCT